MTDAPEQKKHIAPLPKLLLDLGPLLLFFFANSYGGIYFATGAFMVATIITLGISYYLIRRFPVMPIVTAVIVMVFGALTLWLHNDTFIKLKPTIINLIFALILAGGVAFTRVGLLKYLFGPVFHLTEDGWRRLSLRWACFFFALAILNEIVWRNFSMDFWIYFKVFGLIGLMLVFSMSQFPFIQRNMIAEKEPKPEM